MTSRTDFFSSLRHKRILSSSKRVPPSNTSYTLDNWIDIDDHGNGNLLNVNNDSSNASYQPQPSTSSLVSTSASHANTARVQYESVKMNDENDQSSLYQQRNFSGSRLKRKSLQLLKMVERKTSNSLNVKWDKEDDLRKSIRHPTLNGEYGENRESKDYTRGSNDHQSSNCPTNSSPPHTPPSPTLTTPNLPAEPYVSEPDKRSYDHHLEYEFHTHHRITPEHLHSKSLTPIPTCLTSMDTPEYPSFIGDSDSSGRRTTLKPHRMKVPQNSPNDSPLASLGLSNKSRSFQDVYVAKQAKKSRTTFEDLVNLPLPQPNGQPSRYVSYFDHTPNPNDYEKTSTLANEFDVINTDIILGINKIHIEDQNPSDPRNFESSSALEALWEYGSTSSSSSSKSSLSPISKQREIEIELDLEIDLNDYPFPPELSNLSTERSLTQTFKKFENHNPKSHLNKISSSNSTTFTHMENEIKPNPIIDFQISSPLSETFSLEDDEEEEEEEEPQIKSVITFKIPLKFEKPKAQERHKDKKSNLSIDSPFTELYQISNPDKIQHP
ncbi:uncharacterized protein I206_101271 [Kwoniella pini CBS 10737]|uniref:Uncharacterized protein n=1 Tax=Kwoniella pini CBS 10737 TaxID=1296096 RepID=A0A1B9IAV8_9TREE|nr:uncharacterized protein I206_00051 [Kwoniella pini CBS 10737]OCF52755.1 hypothetical protein I206_00051 [Kwoniella pini CBS 10737]